jgi:hypothetical protein
MFAAGAIEIVSDDLGAVVYGDSIAAGTARHVKGRKRETLRRFSVAVVSFMFMRFMMRPVG